jgi:chemotaxis-related protein WspB
MKRHMDCKVAYPASRLSGLHDGMMILLFNVEGDSYGINVRDVIEVLPNVKLKHVPHGPEHLAGLLNYHGQAVPVIDLTLLMSGQASRDRISSRIVLVNYVNGDAVGHLLGLLVEKITETVKIPDDAFTRSGVETDAAPFLGDVAINSGVMVQLIEIRKVLSDAVKSMFFCDQRPVDNAVSGVEN